MKRKIALVIFIMMVVASAHAVSVDIKEDTSAKCEAEETALVSINDTQGGHIAEPGYYGHEVCVEGEIEYNVRDDCTDGEIHVFSMFDRNNSHFSMYSPYKYDVCSRQTKMWTESTCGENGTAVLSVDSGNNSHVAKPDVFSQQLCTSMILPENITLELSGLSGNFYSDGTDNTISPREDPWTALELDYPYIVAEDADSVEGMVSYGDFVKLSHPDGETASMTLSDGSFLLPHTEGGAESIERRREMVLDRDFLRRLSSSFAFFIPDQPTVRVILQPEQEVDGFLDTLRRDISISARNEGLRNGGVVINIEGE